MEKILVIGGAGYIGSYMCKYLDRHRYIPIVLDNLITGHRSAVKWGIFYEGSMADKNLLRTIFKDHHISTIMHFAAFAYVDESISAPDKYYRNNVANTLSLLEIMKEYEVANFIFSSTCATYGEPIEIPITEDHPQHPINPYGRTKVIIEQMLDDFKNSFGIQSISLRYFNAAGADPEGELGENHQPETHLIPLVLQTALGLREAIDIFGNDYNTADGTCIRDYIHIEDLAKAHLLALEQLNNEATGDAYNLGNGKGYSVKEVIDTAQKVTGRSISTRMTDRRVGDPAVLVASSTKARRELGWEPRYPDLRTIIETAWEWHKANPKGYDF